MSMRAELRSDLDLIKFEINEVTYYAVAIPEHPKWFASTCGFIISDKKEVPAVLKGTMRHRGALDVGHRVSGKMKFEKVHRLVARAFFSDAGQDAAGRERNEVNHINGDTCCNRVTNLEWCSRSENINHALTVLQAADYKHIAARNRRPQYGNTAATEAKRKELLLSQTTKAA